MNDYLIINYDLIEEKKIILGFRLVYPSSKYAIFFKKKRFM